MNLLLIDDNVSTTTLLRDSLNWPAIGIQQVFTAKSAAEAKEILDQYVIDILLCDIEMPGQSGLSLLRELRLKGNHAVCIFLTAHAEFEYAKKAIEVDSIDYILKPFTLEDITQKLCRAVALCKERSENNAYIKYGKLWIDQQNHFSPEDREKLIQPVTDTDSQTVNEAKQFIREHYTEDISLTDIADYVHHNPNHLIKLFRRFEDTTPIDYLIRIRIEHAKMLLASNAFSISQVALMTGFRSIPYFNRVFKRQTGYTPSAYKKQHKK